MGHSNKNNLEALKSDSFIMKSFNSVDNQISKINNLETKAFMLVAWASVVFGFMAFHVKLGSYLFGKESFQPFYFMFFRSLSVVFLGYYFLQKKQIKMLDVRTVQNKFWFVVRTFGTFVSFISFIFCLLYLRAATASSFQAFHPVIVIILSIFILKEKFYLRYLIGITVCFLGTLLIILNDKKAPAAPPKIDQFSMDIEEEARIIEASLHSDNLMNFIMGSIWGTINCLCIGMLVISSKVLIVEHIEMENQFLYIGLTNCISALFFIVFTGAINSNIIFWIYSFSNGLIFYYATLVLCEGYKNIDVSKTSPLPYISTIIVFICGVVIIGETIYFTDMIGIGMIIGYNILNTIYPMKK
jgi:drug/metabolite transporter (DMT)-like permease